MAIVAFGLWDYVSQFLLNLISLQLLETIGWSAILVISTIITTIYIGLIVFYFAHMITNQFLFPLLRIVLAICLFLVPPVTMTVYWFIFILPEKPPVWALNVSNPTPYIVQNAGRRSCPCWCGLMPEDELSQGAVSTTKPSQSTSLKFTAAGTVGAVLCFVVVFSGWLRPARPTVALLLCPLMVVAGLSLCLGLVTGVVSLSRREGALTIATLIISILGLALLMFVALMTAFVVIPFSME